MYSGELSLNFNEKVIFALRNLYLSRGYSQYQMSKFEEYDLYARNKDFLISDSVITFTDTNGKLMALKPDVTLSIIKNIKDQPNSLQKLFYNENVYRISKGNNAFKEIMQVGLECFGDIDCYSISEVLTLAAKSLKTISKSCVLDISHLGIISCVMDALEISNDIREEILRCISQKNPHELYEVCKQINISDDDINILKLFISATGSPNNVLAFLEEKLSGKFDITPILELKNIISGVDSDIKDMLRIDFSVANDMKYYNGIAFKGFIEGVPSSVISGGQYDKLMQKMKRKSGAIGFAVYLDLLERLFENNNEFDVDTILIYGDNDNPSKVNSCVNSLISCGKKVLACKTVPENIKYREVLNINDCEVDTCENNA